MALTSIESKVLWEKLLPFIYHLLGNGIVNYKNIKSIVLIEGQHEFFEPLSQGVCNSATSE